MPYVHIPATCRHARQQAAAWDPLWCQHQARLCPQQNQPAHIAAACCDLSITSHSMQAGSTHSCRPSFGSACHTYAATQHTLLLRALTCACTCWRPTWVYMCQACSSVRCCHEQTCSCWLVKPACILPLGAANLWQLHSAAARRLSAATAPRSAASWHQYGALGSCGPSSRSTLSAFTRSQVRYVSARSVLLDAWQGHLRRLVRVREGRRPARHTKAQNLSLSAGCGPAQGLLQLGSGRCLA